MRQSNVLLSQSLNSSESRADNTQRSEYMAKIILDSSRCHELLSGCPGGSFRLGSQGGLSEEVLCQPGGECKKGSVL